MSLEQGFKWPQTLWKLFLLWDSSGYREEEEEEKEKEEEEEEEEWPILVV